MPYTLMKGWVWVLLGVLLGIFIGWLLRSIAAKRQVARARKHHVAGAELERLRARVAELEPAVAEGDRLRAELDACRSEVEAAARAPAVQPLVSLDQPVAADADPAAGGGPPPVSTPQPTPSPTPDLSAARTVLGAKLTLDDLKVIEGIGPKIESLCHGIGIRTWAELSTTEVSLLRTMLADAGGRFASHDPSTWPEQAALLAAGRWDDFVALTDRLSGGRAVD